jgi:hypothetical protein
MAIRFASPTPALPEGEGAEEEIEMFFKFSNLFIVIYSKILLFVDLLTPPLGG